MIILVIDPNIRRGEINLWNCKYKAKGKKNYKGRNGGIARLRAIGQKATDP